MVYVADQVRVEPSQLAAYRWKGRPVEYHRAQIHDAFGFREFTRTRQRVLVTVTKTHPWLLKYAQETSLAKQCSPPLRGGAAVCAPRGDPLPLA